MDDPSNFTVSRRVFVGGMLAGATSLTVSTCPVSAAVTIAEMLPAGYGFVHAIGADGVARLVTVERDGGRVPVIAKLP